MKSAEDLPKGLVGKEKEKKRGGGGDRQYFKGHGWACIPRYEFKHVRFPYKHCTYLAQYSFDSLQENNKTFHIHVYM